MNRIRRPTWTIVVVSAAALMLASCGRKGPLDLPPNSPPAPQLSSAPDTATDAANRPSVFNPSYGADAAPSATRGPKRPFVLDPLLDSR